jgi:hypothetical protein
MSAAQNVQGFGISTQPGANGIMFDVPWARVMFLLRSQRGEVLALLKVFAGLLRDLLAIRAELDLISRMTAQSGGKLTPQSCKRAIGYISPASECGLRNLA